MNDAPKFSNGPTFPSPPRQVRPKPRGCGARFGSLIFGLIALGAALSIAVVPIRWYVQSHGSPVQVTVTGKYITHSSKSGDTYHVKFDYPFDGETVSDNQTVNSIEYARIEEGTTANGKAARVLGINICLTELGDVNRETHMWIFITLFWNVMAWGFVIVGLVQILRSRRLVVDGIAVPGTITNRRISRGRNTTFYVTYQFTPAGGETAVQERSVSAAGYNSVTIGSPVTVLYLAENPRRSIAYECCNYIVET